MLAGLSLMIHARNSSSDLLFSGKSFGWKKLKPGNDDDGLAGLKRKETRAE